MILTQDICESVVMPSDVNQDAPQSNGKATGGLEPTTAMLLADAIASPGKHPHFIRGLALHFAETAIFLVAVIGAIALGLGITAYFAEHRYVLAYLVAYAGFRCSDLIVREDAEDRPPHEELWRRIIVQLPLLVVFAAAPFERTYVYGGVGARRSSKRWGCYSNCSGCGSRSARVFSLDFSRRGEHPSIRCW